MADIVEPAVRSRMMAGIRGRDTRIEIMVRKGLFALGYRYRVDVRGLPGRPDIVLPRRRAVILVHGCFWHLHGCRLSKIPATRREFWMDKLLRNRERDVQVEAQLHAAGWRTAKVWECALRGKGGEGLEVVVSGLDAWLRGGVGDAEFAG